MQAVMSSPFNAYTAQARPARAQFGAGDGCDNTNQPASWGLTKTSVAAGALGFLVSYPFAHSAQKSVLAGAGVAGMTAGAVALNNRAHQGKLDCTA